MKSRVSGTAERLQGQVDVYSRALDFYSCARANPCEESNGRRSDMVGHLDSHHAQWVVYAAGATQPSKSDDYCSPTFNCFGETLQALEARGLAVGMRTKLGASYGNASSSELEPQEVARL